MKGKIVELEYDVIKGNATFVAECDYKDFYMLRKLWDIYKTNKIDIDFNPTEYNRNYPNDTVDGITYATEGLINNEFLSKISMLLSRYSEPKTEVIFNEPATILYKDGEKYICKCDKEDKFNEELGLALCLLKSFGVSYSDFKELLKGAKRQKGRNNGKN